MSDRLPAIIKECEERLAEHRHWLHHALEEGGQQDDPPAIMIRGAVDLGIQTIKAIDLLVATDLSNAPLACTLTRAFFEAAVRVLWASRCLPNAQHPWIRLQVYWAAEDLKWANEAIGFPSLQASASAMQTAREKVRDRVDPNGKTYVKAPDILTMLADIEKANVSQGLGSQRNLAPGYIYANLYRILCGPAHGRPFPNEKLESYLRHARIGLILAAAYILETVCHVGTTDPPAAIRELAQKIVNIAEANDE